ncbi:hypothetical protein HPB47_014644 [Ixodes persulcatus]|uniref:Uncharacterized protein n=1 Tax=Ixodes persulcatus TaxID=34615 RepID=A0AC60QZ22_IXOPE|nr:hypothetical protein HPB47_014644 [Ixodes persulcatus]
MTFKTLSLEALLLKLRARNLSDVQFLVVNSLDSAAEVRQLERRVSFPVYQETANEPVWSVLEGDKDDVFIYDRCGRLSYFIPFPLSVTLPGRHPVVEEALNTTYYASPCGDFCAQDPSTIPHGSSPHEHQQGKSKPKDEGEPGNTVSPPTTPSEGLGWRVIHMVFGDGHQGQVNSHTPSQGKYLSREGGVTTGAPHDHRERHPTPTECVSINKAICFDWPKERIRHVESCCNHTVRSRSYHFRHSCRRLTRRQCKKLHHVFSCCKRLHEALDRQISQDYEGIQTLLDEQRATENDSSRAVTVEGAANV